MHHRHLPIENGFLYKQHYTVLKVSKDFTPTTPLLSINKFNLFSFAFHRHGKRSGENPYGFALELLKNTHLDIQWLDDLYVVFQPAILGWSFNPATFWFYLDKDKKIRAVWVEVNNTFGEHQHYLAYHDDFRVIEKDHILKAKKVFYVSPFFKVEGEYEFRFVFSEEKVGVWINYFIKGEKFFSTAVTGNTYPLSSKNLLKSLFQIPLSHLKTIFLIHWQALKLWIKGVKYIHRKKHLKKKEERCH